MEEHWRPIRVTAVRIAAAWMVMAYLVTNAFGDEVVYKAGTTEIETYGCNDGDSCSRTFEGNGATFSGYTGHNRPGPPLATFRVYRTDEVWSRGETYKRDELFTRKEVEDMLAAQAQQLRQEFASTIERRMIDALASVEAELSELRSRHGGR